MSRADASRFIAEGITTPHARHRVATRQASPRPTAGGATIHAMHPHDPRHAAHQATRQELLSDTRLTSHQDSLR